MTYRKTAPAKKLFRVFADDVQHVFQDIEANTEKQAHELAQERRDFWEQCDEHDSNGIRISSEVQNMATGEFTRIDQYTRCQTCGSEIIDSTNESSFRDGECGPCEHKRYLSQPALLDACHVALQEIWRWDDGISGTDNPDPEQEYAIETLQHAIAKADDNLPGTASA